MTRKFDRQLRPDPDVTPPSAFGPVPDVPLDFADRIMRAISQEPAPSPLRTLVAATRVRAWSHAASAISVAWHLATVRTWRVPMRVRVHSLALVLAVAGTLAAGTVVAANVARLAAGPMIGLFQVHELRPDDVETPVTDDGADGDVAESLEPGGGPGLWNAPASPGDGDDGEDPDGEDPDGDDGEDPAGDNDPDESPDGDDDPDGDDQPDGDDDPEESPDGDSESDPEESHDSDDDPEETPEPDGDDGSDSPEGGPEREAPDGSTEPDSD